MDEQKVAEFIEYASNLEGYERGEAQLFLERLFLAFGNKGVLEAGATLEHKIIIDSRTKFCDLLWPGVVLIEMKSRGQELGKHVYQAKTYWDNTYGNRPQYVVLCNFEEFWIFNWNLQRDPLDKVPVSKLVQMWKSLAFLSVEGIKPMFGNNLVEVTEEAAEKIAQLYASLLSRGIERRIARRYSLQCLVCLFAEDTGLFPDSSFFSTVVDECRNGQSTYDLFTLLFRQMNSQEEAGGGKFREVKYFDGGIFSEVFPLELTKNELALLLDSTKYDWSKVQPSIFGTIFEDSLEKAERHLTGAHYTLESEIMSVVEPTILRPWRERIAKAKTLKKLNEIRKELSTFRVLDPACGSGNFLYVAFRELKFLELQLFQKMLDNYPSTTPQSLHSKIRCSQFYGIDVNPLGIELAKITLSMAKMFAVQEFNKFTKQHRFYDESENPLPFDNLDDNFTVGDALFVPWPKAVAIIGNPPYQSKNKMQDEFGPAYLDKLHQRFPEMPGLADYCVYWFRKAHDMLPMGGRAGLVGTNTIRQTYSREGGLDYIVAHDGVILEAIGSRPWGGTAVVHVSIVNWIKSDQPQEGIKKLRIQLGEKRDGPWEEYELPLIPSSLSPRFDVTKAKSLVANEGSDACLQGQTHGHEGFLIDHKEAQDLMISEPQSEDVIFPYLIANDLIGTTNSQPSRYVIDFGKKDIFSAKKYSAPFKIVEDKVLPDRKKAYDEEEERNSEALAENPRARVNHHHKHFLERWWQLSYARENLISKLDGIDRYIACSRVTKRPIFEFIASNIRPSDSLVAFILDDDYSFGILQSSMHWQWFVDRCSTLKDDFRYTSNTVFDSFPWPQWGILEKDLDARDLVVDASCIKIVKRVASTARELREMRNKLRKESGTSLRDLYRILELPGTNPLREAHEKLDEAVLEAYRYDAPPNIRDRDELEFLFMLGNACSDFEKSGRRIFGPGLPSFCNRSREFYSEDCIRLDVILNS